MFCWYTITIFFVGRIQKTVNHLQNICKRSTAAVINRIFVINLIRSKVVRRGGTRVELFRSPPSYKDNTPFRSGTQPYVCYNVSYVFCGGRDVIIIYYYISCSTLKFEQFKQVIFFLSGPSSHYRSRNIIKFLVSGEN